MTETQAILKAAQAAQAAGKRVALATVVQVEGSSYRRPGARMLITEEGILTGAISGGCLEGDALRKALLALQENKTKLVTYDSLDEADAEVGMQLGCNGKVDILFEPIHGDYPHNPITLLAHAEAQSEDCVLAVVWELAGREHAGTVLLQTNRANESALPAEEGRESLLEQLQKGAFLALQNGSTEIKEVGSSRALFQVLKPPVQLVIAGAGNDVKPVVQMAAQLGWQVTVADGRASHATQARFPEADKVVVARAENLVEATAVNSRTVCLLMTHNYQYDLAALQKLLPQNPVYLGILGPRKRWQKLEAELASLDFLITEAQRKIVYAPLGLDIGAESAAEIALSVLSEIQGVLAGGTAQPLRDKGGPIHVRNGS